MTTWGSYKNIGGTLARIGLDLSYSPSSVTSSTASVTVSWTLRLQTQGWANGNDDWSVSGGDSASGTKSWSHPTGTTSVVASGSKSVTLTRGATQPFSLSAAMQDLAGSTTDLSVSASITIPARPYDPPAPVTGLSVTRVSDTRQNLAWSVTSTSAAPVQSVEIRRMDQVNAYATIATPSGAATAYADTSTRADRHYRYAVRTRNSAGWSPFVYFEIDTTPAKMGTPSAGKNSSGDIVVTRGSISAIAETWEAWEAGGGLLQAGIPASQETWTYSSPSPSKPWAFVTRALSGSPVLYGAYSTSSNTVALVTAPNAPSNLLPYVLDPSEANELTWSHNSVDTTPQTAWTLRWREYGSSTWTTIGRTTSSTSSYTLSAGTWPLTTAGVEWQVSTWGQATTGGRDGTGASEWSASRVTVTSGRPTVGIVAPDLVLTASRVTVEWSFFDPESTNQSRWQVVLAPDGSGGGNSGSETKAGPGAASSVTMDTPLPDGSTWTVEVTAWDGHNLPGSDSRTFTVEWASPPVPTGEATWYRDDGFVVLTPSAPAPSGDEVAVDHFDVYRATSGGYVLVASDVAEGESVTDRTPPTGEVVTYRVVAVSDLPSTAVSEEIVVQTRTRWVFLSWGPDFSRTVRVWGNVSANRSASRARTLHHFAGRRLPVEFAGDAITRTYSLTATIFGKVALAQSPDESSTWADFDELATEAIAPVLVRDPEGVRIFCSVGDPSLSDHLGVHPGVSVPLTQVDYPEEVVQL